MILSLVWSLDKTTDTAVASEGDMTRDQRYDRLLSSLRKQSDTRHV